MISPHLIQITKEIPVQHLIPVGTVETLDIRILVVLAGLCVLENNTIVPVQFAQSVTQEVMLIFHPEYVRDSPYSLSRSSTRTTLNACNDVSILMARITR